MHRLHKEALVKITAEVCELDHLVCSESRDESRMFSFWSDFRDRSPWVQEE